MSTHFGSSRGFIQTSPGWRHGAPPISSLPCRPLKCFLEIEASRRRRWAMRVCPVAYPTTRSNKINKIDVLHVVLLLHHQQLNLPPILHDLNVLCCIVWNVSNFGLPCNIAYTTVSAYTTVTVSSKPLHYLDVRPLANPFGLLMRLGDVIVSSANYMQTI